jgi:short-subunit dehydrogenase
MRRTSEEFGAIDVLVNNAGVGLFAPIADGNPDNARYLFDVNVWGAVNCIQAAAPYMRDQGEGHIVNISSIAGHISPPYMGMYAATKHALAAISDALRNEIASDGIGVTTVYPGLTETAFTENMLQEVEAPRIPPVVRFVPAEAVARRIYQAIRWNLRDVYVAPEDIAAILSDAFLPAISDQVMRWFIRPGARRNVSFRRRVAERENSSELADS